MENRVSAVEGRQEYMATHTLATTADFNPQPDPPGKQRPVEEFNPQPDPPGKQRPTEDFNPQPDAPGKHKQ